MTFGGSYRFVDFALTNLANLRGLDRVGILTQYRPSSLVEHVGIGLPWNFVGTERGIHILSPYTGPVQSEWYRGTADALHQNLDFLDLHRPDDVLLVSGDHAYNMDYGPLLRFHMERNADATLAFTPVAEGASRFGIGELDSEGRVKNYVEKPRHPRTDLASMTVYVFRRQVLVEELERHAALPPEERRTHQIYDEILPHLVRERRAYGWVHRGPWEYARTLDAYHAAHRALLGSAPRLEIDAWNVRTNPFMRRLAPPPPARLLPGAEVVDSLIAPGCRIAGRVEGSVLSPEVRVGRGAVVRDSVLWDRVVVEEGAVCVGVIADRRAVIGAGARVGAAVEGAGAGESPAPPNDEVPESLAGGSVVLGMDVRVPPGLEIGRNCILYPGAGAEQLTGPVAAGRTIRLPMRWSRSSEP